MMPTKVLIFDKALTENEIKMVGDLLLKDVDTTKISQMLSK